MMVAPTAVARAIHWAAWWVAGLAVQTDGTLADRWAGEKAAWRARSWVDLSVPQRAAHLVDRWAECSVAVSADASDQMLAVVLVSLLEQKLAAQTAARSVA